MSLLKNKIGVIVLLGLTSWLIAPTLQAACTNSLSGVFCGGNQVACRASNGLIECVDVDNCDPNTKRCLTTPVTSTPGLTPAYLNVSAAQNNGFLRINQYVEVLGEYLKATGNLIVDGLATIQNLTIPGQLKLTNSPGVGKVLVSDAEGLASWQTLPEIIIPTSTVPNYEIPSFLQTLSKSPNASAFAGTVLLGTSVKPAKVANLSVFGTVTGRRLIANQVNATSTLSGNLWTKKNLTVNGKSSLGLVSATDISADEIVLSEGWRVGNNDTYWKGEIRDFDGLKIPLLSSKLSTDSANSGRGAILNGVVLFSDYGNINTELTFTSAGSPSNEFNIAYNGDNNSVYMGGIVDDNGAPIRPIELFALDSINNINIKANNNLGIDAEVIDVYAKDMKFFADGGNYSFYGGDFNLVGGYKDKIQKLNFGGGAEYIYSVRDENAPDRWGINFATGGNDTVAEFTKEGNFIAHKNIIGVGNISTSKNIYIYNGGSLNFGGGAEYIYSVRDENAPDRFGLNFAVNGADRLVLATGGNVGIGNSNPDVKLAIGNGTGSGNIIGINGVVNNYVGTRINIGGSEKWFIGNDDNNNFVVRVNNTNNSLNISSSGKASLSSAHTENISDDNDIITRKYLVDRGVLSDYGPCKPGTAIGDVNGDGLLLVNDYTQMSRYTAGLDPLPSNTCCIDTNSNGVVNTVDWVKVGRIVAGLDPIPGYCGAEGPEDYPPYNIFNSVGIGLLNPSEKLDVNGTVRASNLKLINSSKGACNADNEGKIVYEVINGVGSFHGCVMTGQSTYVWKKLDN